MGSRRALARQLERLAGFADPRVDLEQYPTPPEIAASVIHLATLREDLADRTVIDLGSGPGILAIGSAFGQPARVIGVEIDPAALRIATANAQRVDPPVDITWVQGDATRPPICPVGQATVMMNPPFGAQQSMTHADRGFLAAAADIAAVSYSFHNAGSRAFVESFAADHGGTVTDAMAAEFDLAHQFSFHDAASVTVDAELFRITWR